MRRAVSLACASVAAGRARGYIPFVTMATNGANGKTKPAKKRSRRLVTPKASAAEVRAMREYLKMTGHKFDPKRLAKIRAQWAD